MRTTCISFCRIIASICLIYLVDNSATIARADVAYVTDDTYLDSVNDFTNYDTSSGIKVFVNKVNPTPTHGLIALPSSLGSIPANELNSVKLWVYNMGSQTLSRPMELHPLTTGFVTSSATWDTSDGSTPWTTPGGDYGPDHVDVSAPVVSKWCAFDITSMLTGSDRTNLLSNGLLLKMFDDGNSPTATTGQNFVSSNNTTLTADLPYFQVIYYGDYDGNHVVDAADYVLWRDSGGSATDYDIWRQNFGQSVPPAGGASLQGNAAVPEPGSLPLVIVGLLGALKGRRSRS